MQDLKNLQQKLDEYGFDTEIDGNKLYVQKGTWANSDVWRKIRDLPKPKFTVTIDMDITGEKLFIVTRNRFLNGWW